MSTTAIFPFIQAASLLLIVYLAVRFAMMLKGHSRLQWVVCPAILGLFAAFPFGRFLESRLPSLETLSSALIVVGSIAIAPLFYAILLTLTSDFILLICRITGRLSRLRARPHIRLYTCASIVLLALLICGIGRILAVSTVVREIELTIPVSSAYFTQNGARSRLTLAALSDIHLGRLVSADHLAKLVGLIKARQPDLVLFLGDTIDDLVGLDRPRIAEILHSINAPFGTWGIEGNHEHYAGLSGALKVLDDSGVEVLADQWATPGNAVLLIGRHDRTIERRSGKRLSIDEILAQVPAEIRQKPIILMDHQPVEPGLAAEAGVALELSGHTHNGQLFPFNLFTGLIYEHLYGHYQIGRTHYWVSSGAGTWGPPVRTSGRSEILLITLNFVAQKE